MRKVVSILQTGLASLALMAYGWVLGQKHQSGYDIAGILLFFTGAAGWGLALFIRWLTRKLRWHDRWHVNVLTGMMGCGLVFALVLAYARVHG